MTGMMTKTTVGQAIQIAMEGRISSQTELAEHLGIAQSTVHRYLADTFEPGLDTISAIEDACERPRGFILRATGHATDEPTDVLLLLELDGSIDDAARQILIDTYEDARRRRRRAKRGES